MKSLAQHINESINESYFAIPTMWMKDINKKKLQQSIPQLTKLLKPYGNFDIRLEKCGKRQILLVADVEATGTEYERIELEIECNTNTTFDYLVFGAMLRGYKQHFTYAQLNKNLLPKGHSSLALDKDCNWSLLKDSY